MIRARMSGVGLGLAVTAAAIVWDPGAHAAEPKRVVALVVAIGAAASALLSDRTRVDEAHNKWSWTWKLAAAFLALSALSALWGTAAAMLDLGTWAAAAICAVASASRGREIAIRTARTAALTTGAILSAWALVVVAAGHRGFAVHAGQGNPNWLGLVLALTLPLSIDALHTVRVGDFTVVDRRATREPPPRSHHRWRAFMFALVAIQPAALYASHSRASWIATALALTWMAWRLRKSAFGDRPAHRGALKLVAASAMLVGLVVAAERTHAHSPARASSTAPPAPASASSSPEDVTALRSFAGRRWIAARSIEALSERNGALFGAGLGRFSHVYLDAQGEALAKLGVRPAARGFLNATTAHNEPLQVAVESGPLAALALLLALVAAFIEHRRRQWNGGAAATLALAVASLGDSPLRQPAVCLLVGLICAAASTSVTQPRAFYTNPRFAMVASLASAALLLISATRSWLGTRALEAAYVATEPAHRLAGFKKATQIDPGSADAWLARGIEELAEGRVDDAVTHLSLSDQRSPSIAARVAQGEAYLAKQDPEAARRALLRALEIAPGSLRARLALAQAERKLGHIDEAARHATLARSIAPFDPRVVDINEHVHEDAMDAFVAEDSSEETDQSKIR